MIRPLAIALAAMAPLAFQGCGEARRLPEGSTAEQQCGSCHFTAATVAAPAAAGARPPSGAHAAHLVAGRVAGPMSCAECHPVPQAIGSPGHDDGRVDVAFSERAGGAKAWWNRESASCAASCHGDARPVWSAVDGSQVRCGACHGIPPGGTHPASTACNACHPATVRPDGSLNLTGGAHVNGRVDRGGDTVVACGSCHGIPPGGGHTTSTNCGGCHPGYGPTSVNAALHQNGKKDVLVSGAACGSCHAIPPPPPHATSTACGSCHPGYSATTVNAALHQNGKKDVLTVEASCGACHGIPPAAPHVQSTSCGTCHEGYTSRTVNAALHQNGRPDVLSAEQSCGACHGIPPAAPHVQSASCGSCHEGYTSRTVNAALHRNGRNDVLSDQQACGACHGIPPGGRHPANTNCGACHDGYSARSVNAALHRNGRNDVLPVEASCGACHGIPPGGTHTSSTTCGTCHQGYTSTRVNAAVHQNGRVDVTAQACGSCHAIPPATGRHRDHVEEGISCGRCHQGASASAGGPGHMNGVVNVSAPGWNASTRSCANACHGNERWSGGGGDGDDD